MTNMEDLIWLYKMALDYKLDAEKEWLKSYIEENFKNINHQDSKATIEMNAETISPLDTEKIAA